MEIKIQVFADQNRTNSMTSVDVPKLKQLLEYDFWHKMDQVRNKSVRSMVIFFLKNKTECIYIYITNEINIYI